MILWKQAHAQALRAPRAAAGPDLEPAAAEVPSLPLSPLLDNRPEENRALLQGIAWSLMACGAVVSAANLLNGLDWRPGGVILFLVGMLMALAVWLDRFALAVWIMCLGALAINGASALMVKGLLNTSWIALPIAVMAAGWLLGRRAVWCVAGLGALQSVVFYGLHRSAYVFSDSVPLESRLAGLLVALAVAAQVGEATSRVFHRQLARIRRSQNELQLVLNSSYDLICSLEAKTWRLRAFNRVFLDTLPKLYGVTPSLGQALSETLAAKPRHRDGLLALLSEALRVGHVQRLQPLFNGDQVFDIRLWRVDQPDGDVMVTLFATDVTEKILAHRQLEFLAYHDPVTQLPNRASAQRALAALMQGEPQSTHAVSLLVVHLHDVNAVNDSCGHMGGDEYLKACAHRISQVISLQGKLYRMPGNDMLVILPGLEGQAMLSRICERLFAGFAAAMPLHGHSLQVTASMGVASFDLQGEHGYTTEQMMACANLALDEAMRLGPGHYSFYQADMSNSLYRQLRTRADLANAMFNNELVLYYQPIVQADTLQPLGAEALLRWQHPREGLLGPGEFITVAESSGYIKKLGRWVLFTACEEAKRWQDVHGKALTVAVNISPLHFAHACLLDDVQNALAKSGLPPHCLELEITETTLLQHHATVSGNLKALRAQGVRIAIDDFGTGFSNLSYLRQFPIDKIKIDKMFISAVDQNPGQAAIVKGLVEMAQGNGLQVVAEGVETLTELQALQAMGCDQVQGYHVANPISAVEWLARVSEQRLRC